MILVCGHIAFQLRRYPDTPMTDWRYHVHVMDMMLQDLRYALRMLRKNLRFSALIVIIVAIGVGAAATIFSIVEKTLLWNENPNSGRWIIVRSFFPHQNLSAYRLSAAEYFDLRTLTDVFEQTGAIASCNLTLHRDNYPELIGGACVSANMIPITTASPMLGRIFTAEDDEPGAPLTVVLTYELWQRRFHGDRSILGQSLRMNNDYYTVIGVMPPHYALWDAEYYMPFQLNPANQDRTDRRAWITALLRPGVSPEQAHARLDQLARVWERDHAGTNPEYKGLKLTAPNLKQAVLAGSRPALLILMAAVLLIVIISCANIGNLLLARGSTRRREMAVRAALGAPRFRIVRQFLSESLVLAIAGGILGVLLAFWALPTLMATVPFGLPNLHLIRVDTGAVLLGLAVAVLMGIIFGLAPALYSARGDLARAVREGDLQAGTAREGRWVRSALVVSQIALATVVLTGAGLMLRTYRELLQIDLGINPASVLTAQLAFQSHNTPEKIVRFHQEVVSRVEQIPGVQSAATTNPGPMLDYAANLPTQDFFLAGHEGEKNVPNANLRVVTPDYFSVTGTPLLRGRLFNQNDTVQSERVIVINQTMARLYWPGADPIGQSIRLGSNYGQESGPGDGRWVKIVGVVADAHQVRMIEVPPRQEIFFPVVQRPELARAATLMVRSSLPTETLTLAVRRAVAQFDPDSPVFDVQTMAGIVSSSFGPRRMMTALLSFFALVAIILASVGLYAVMAYSVSQRTREIGIRMALGANTSNVLRNVLGEGWRLAALGLAGGLIGAVLATKLMNTLVYGISTTDPMTFLIAAALLSAVAMTASYFPARRATEVDPIIALRCE